MHSEPPRNDLPITAEPKPKVVGVIKHPVWISIGAIASVLAIAATVFSYVQQRTRPADLAIGAVSIEDPTPIAAIGTVPGLGETVPFDGYTVTPVDITVTNSGDESTRITRVTAEPLGSVQWRCSRQGGSIAVSAEYSIKLPTTSGQSEFALREGSASIDYTVNGGSSDRMKVTVGPVKDGDGLPLVFFIGLRLETDDGRTINTKPIALMTVGGIDEQLTKFGGAEIDDMEPGWRGCASDYIELVETAMPTDAVRSPELDRWLDGLARVTRG